MPPLKVLIVGGGCAGPCLAFWLARSGHEVTVVERFPALRASGAQVDIRAQGIQVLKRMGLMDAVRRELVDEAGVSLVDDDNKSWATFMANKTGKGAQSATSEYEIMRGDLVNIFHAATKNSVRYIFGRSVEDFEQDESGVTVRLSDKTTARYDLLVGADGQGSRIRKAMLPSDAPDPVRHLGLYMAYWFLPRGGDDSNMRKMYHLPGSRMIMRRTHSPAESHVYFALKDDSPELRSLPKRTIDSQKHFWAAKFSGGRWETQRFIDSMHDTSNFYCQEIVQVRIETWSKDRVVLLGDAAHCPSPLTAMGTTGAITAAYVLAGELNRHSHDIPLALRNYEKTLRPFIDEIQKMNGFFWRIFYPRTKWGVFILHCFVGFLSFFKIPYLFARFSREERGGWVLPMYDEVDKSVPEAKA
ncbi:FAD/NAD(P)-binding domain-containing protein [Polyplosphaeria fusca]|uniref:FAD/NAD(P)-binding domain-containing protein n=1 Tax=Polyplosphaeria fusca TaxID=682080 RepID=A0A9P4QT69_9PLEO|nr:FAD/NAD(P)-binding domain-containing protein [Polyplosphaeria fusca]